MAKIDKECASSAKVTRASQKRSGTVDNRDVLKPGQWDRSGAGEIETGAPSTVGAEAGRPGSDNKTSAGV